MADVWDGFIIGTASAILATIIAQKWLDQKPAGGATPRQVAAYSPTSRGGVLYVEEVQPLTPGASPLKQNTPITEAAYNQYPTVHRVAFGTRENMPDTETLIPM